LARQSSVGRRILMGKRNKQDGIPSLCQMVQQYEKEVNRNSRIKRLENVIYKIFQFIIGYNLLIESKTITMPSQTWTYLGRGLGMMMTSKNKGLDSFMLFNLCITI
jgi:hypothetical protein